MTLYQIRKRVQDGDIIRRKLVVGTDKRKTQIPRPDVRVNLHPGRLDFLVYLRRDIVVGRIPDNDQAIVILYPVLFARNGSERISVENLNLRKNFGNLAYGKGVNVVSDIPVFRQMFLQFKKGTVAAGAVENGFPACQAVFFKPIPNKKHISVRRVKTPEIYPSTGIQVVLYVYVHVRSPF